MTNKETIIIKLELGYRLLKIVMDLLNEPLTYRLSFKQAKVHLWGQFWKKNHLKLSNLRKQPAK